MASIDTARDAIIARLQGMPDRPDIAYPNGPIIETLPRLYVQKIAPSQGAANLDGETDATARVLARIEVEASNYDAEATQILGNIENLFPVGLTLQDQMWVENLPQAQADYETGGVFYRPVIIEVRYIFGG